VTPDRALAYVADCTRWSLLAVEHWAALLELLPVRDHRWHFEHDGLGAPMWCFGELGACVLSVTAKPDGFTAYDHTADHEQSFYDFDGLAWWLDKHEPERRGLTPTQEQLLDLLASPSALEKLLGRDSSE